LVKKSDFFSQNFKKYRPSSSWLKEEQLQFNLAQLMSSRSSQLKLAQSLSSSWLNLAQHTLSQLSSAQLKTTR